MAELVAALRFLQGRRRAAGDIEILRSFAPVTAGA
jgi:hypothetical protein